ncbi:MAG: hypothetical protein M3Y55_18565, partial [Pseudomonadota bacterium]|nr:hypothetical protein [Pseudomonadota bacterium]
LKTSRALLRSALLGIAHPPAPPPLMAKGIGGLGGQLLARARNLPGVALVMEGVQTWWLKSPARRAVALAEPTARQTVAFVGRRNPQALLLTSAAVGALVVIAPWRRLLPRLILPVLFSGVLYEVAKKAIVRDVPR